MAHLNSAYAEQRNHRQIGLWLLICCALIFSMVVLGGVTRLTGSGLSMVEWDPIMGIVPPLTETQWEDVYDKYKQSPEYQQVNLGMELAGFKRIFLYEYAHRVLGRLIGMVFFIPFVFFALARKISWPLMPKLVVMFVLGGLQGLLGWYMVKSGLVDNPHVSQYRLTAHLAAAVVIYAYMFWVALDLLDFERQSRPGGRSSPLRPFAWVSAGLIFLTILSGGFVAGTKAGQAYNTFPLMNGKWIPDGLLALDPAYRNLFENITTVQFDHRLLATLALVGVVVFWWTAMRTPMVQAARLAVHLLFAMALIQVALGISTLLLHVPVSLASAHQAGALVLLTLVLYALHAMGSEKIHVVETAA